ncbi:MAG TPA: dienelactone hydrolase family protein [Candidatus Acidoferrum sp.]
MESYIKLSAGDGHQLEAYVAEPAGPARAAIVVIQEIFGVNSHIRSVADGYAAQGFWTIAPALFDRVEPRIELGYDSPEFKRGMQIATQIGIDNALKDVAAAVTQAGIACPGMKVGVVGYCFGGTLAWLAATRLGPAAAVGYYGGQISQFAGETPRCPVMLHFGSKDAHIPAEDVEKIRRSHPGLPIYLYDAGHGFNCDQRQSYEPKSAALARQRSLEFFSEHLA